MNTLSKDNCTENCHINNCYSVPSESILMCNEVNFGPVSFPILIPNTKIVNLPIAEVSINTSHMTDPKLLINFTGILTANLAAGDMDSTFNFTLFKTCPDSLVRQPLKNFSFTLTMQRISSYSDSRALKFKYYSCDCPCADCCIYTLELKSVTNNISNGSFSIIINGNICAIATE